MPLANLFVAIVLVVTGIIHILPVSGVLGMEQLVRLYGIQRGDEHVALLLRHRAVLFGLLGTLMLVSSIRIEWQWVGLLLGLLSTASFLVLSNLSQASSSALARVVLVDRVLVVTLTLAAVCWLYNHYAVLPGD